MAMATGLHQEQLQLEEVSPSGELQANARSIGDGRGGVVLSVRNVSKKFCKSLRRSMAYGIVDLAKNLAGIKPDSATLRKDEFWALDDVSFELRRGETLGLIGVNGSGKTTLLRLIAGIFPPDKGEVSVKGRVGALIAVGAGFHPHMTGRENIYLNGTILGMSREEIKAKFHEIVEFAEIGDFLDAPVSTYSSGMRVRLGFSIAAAINPDVLLIDEVLAVGDIGFKMKCYRRINEIVNRAAVVFVSHSMPQIARIATNIVLLDKGRCLYESENVAEGIRKYYDLFGKEEGVCYGEGIEVKEVDVYTDESCNKGDEGVLEVNYSDDLFVGISFLAKRGIDRIRITVAIYDQDLRAVAACMSDVLELSSTGTSNVTLRIPEILFSKGLYTISLVFHEVLPDSNRRNPLIHFRNVVGFRLISPNTSSTASFTLKGQWYQS